MPNETLNAASQAMESVTRKIVSPILGGMLGIEVGNIIIEDNLPYSLRFPLIIACGAVASKRVANWIHQ